MTRRRAGRAADEDHDPAGRRDGFASVTIGVDGTCIVCAAVSLDGGPRIAVGCVGAVPIARPTSRAGSTAT